MLAGQRESAQTERTEGVSVGGDLDLFEMFRWIMAVVCTVYAAVVTWRSLAGWLGYFQSSRETAVLGRYTLVLLLRMRFRRFAGELVQIVILTILLVVLLNAHRGWSFAQ